ncbi:MarR family winged helix-turn-helix transcriptional regulator [Jiangella asiatica]|uniref:MarR family transcriptional regulator n=1 Tax=Jiangella asiatica TaxID=2530372 RepID=A0A4R5C6L7_9ACTN|nr:MarR family winged helix-turn-helix transcriptional regulator [Jiangella asiatica]TDD95411.1 MarR family transcriptional regulator [Jiangella asiatica]
MADHTHASGALGRTVTTVGDQPREFADALMAFLSTARRTRGRLQPLFDDITVPQLVLLDAIEECGRDGVGVVANLTGLTQPTVTRSAAFLIRDGLVRYGDNGGDGRRRALELTERGSEVLAAKRDVVAGHLAGAWDDLSPAERALVVPLLRHLSELVERLF